MAKIIENEKGFKVIEISAEEMVKIGCGNICDHCGQPNFGTGYYVAVLNRWFCPSCYNEWYEDAYNYANDEYNPDWRIERKNFKMCIERLGDMLKKENNL